jgi:hypothetical protein
LFVGLDYWIFCKYNSNLPGSKCFGNGLQAFNIQDYFLRIKLVLFICKYT